MKTLQSIGEQSALRKTVICIALSTFYFAMLAYPFGITKHGFELERMILAGVIFFAISIPVWVINIKREFYSEDEAKNEAVAEPAVARKESDIAHLAILNRWLSPEEVKQILLCQKIDGKKFGEVAVKRNFLTLSQVKSLLEMQGPSQPVPATITEKL